MQLWQYCLLVTAMLLYMFRKLFASIIRSTKTVVAATGAAIGRDDIYPVRLPQHYIVLWQPYWIYIIPTNGMHQWLLLKFLVLLTMDAKSVRNM